MEPGTSLNLQGSGPIRGRRQLGRPAGTHRQSRHKEETREYHMQRLNHKAPPALVAFAVRKAQRGASAPPHAPHPPPSPPSLQKFRSAGLWRGSPLLLFSSLPRLKSLNINGLLLNAAHFPHKRTDCSGSPRAPLRRPLSECHLPLSATCLGPALQEEPTRPLKAVSSIGFLFILISYRFNLRLPPNPVFCSVCLRSLSSFEIPSCSPQPPPYPGLSPPPGSIFCGDPRGSHPPRSCKENPRCCSRGRPHVASGLQVVPQAAVPPGSCPRSGCPAPVQTSTPNPQRPPKPGLPQRPPGSRDRGVFSPRSRGIRFAIPENRSFSATSPPRSCGNPSSGGKTVPRRRGPRQLGIHTSSPCAFGSAWSLYMAGPSEAARRDRD